MIPHEPLLQLVAALEVPARLLGALVAIGSAWWGAARHAAAPRAASPTLVDVDIRIASPARRRGASTRRRPPRRR